MSTLSSAEIREMIRKEMKDILKDELAKHFKQSMKNGDLKKETNKLVKDALGDLYKFMWVRKSVWQNEIGR